MNWYLEVLKKYAVFSGRARRKEYWFFVLFNVIFALVVSFISNLIGFGMIIYYVYILAVLVPSIAVAVRRLHDIGKSGVWYLLVFIPFVGAIWLIVLFCQESQAGSNIYGENPKAFSN